MAQNLMLEGKLAKSEHILLQLIEFVPKLPQTYKLLARIQTALNQHEQAILSIENSISLEPNNSNTLHIAAHVYRKNQQLDIAINYLNKAINLNPKKAEYQNELGIIYAITGAKEKAYKAYSTAISLKPDCIEAYWNRSQIASTPLSDSEIDHLIALSNSKLSYQDKTKLHFTLARSFRQNNDIDSEFVHLIEANNSMEKNLKWNIEKEINDKNKILSLFNEELIKEAKLTTHPEKFPIIICSMPRSGSSLLEQIISSHSDVTAYGENLIFSSAVWSAAKEVKKPVKYWHWLEPEKATSFASTVGNFIESRLSNQKLTTRTYTDKSIFNFFNLGLLLLIYPNAKAIHILRHPLDVSLSCFQLYFAKGQEFSYSLTGIATLYKIHIELMNHWKRLFPENILTIRYEDLVSDQAQWIRRIINFCDLPWEEHCLTFYDNVKSVQTGSFDQVRKPIYKSAVGRWKPYAKYLEPAADVLGITVD